MLYLTLDEREWYDDEKGMFMTDPPITVAMEHSLLAIAQWESKHKKPLLTLMKDGGLTSEELLDYFGFMVIDPPEHDPTSIIVRFSPKHMQSILEYIDDTQTATVIIDREKGKPSRQRLITSELVYCWMIGNNVDKSYETWNINRLLTLLRVISIELNPDKKKMKKSEVASMQRDINEINKAKLKTRG